MSLVLRAAPESMNTTSKTKDVLYVAQLNLNRIKEKGDEIKVENYHLGKLVEIMEK